MTNKTHITIITLLVVAVAFFYLGSQFGGNNQTTVLGAAGQTQSGRAFFGDGATIGGTVMSTTSAASSYSITAAELARTPQVIRWLPNLNTTLTISSTSTLAYVPNIGDTAEIYLLNASTTQASTITLAAGTGLDLQFAEATGGDLVLNGLDWAKLTLIRGAANTVTLIFDEMTEAD